MARRKMINGDEVDAFAKDHLVHNWKPGERKRIKASANRRERREARLELRR